MSLGALISRNPPLQKNKTKKIPGSVAKCLNIQKFDNGLYQTTISTLLLFVAFSGNNDKAQF